MITKVLKELDDAIIIASLTAILALLTKLIEISLNWWYRNKQFKIDLANNAAGEIEDLIVELLQTIDTYISSVSTAISLQLFLKENSQKLKSREETETKINKKINDTNSSMRYMLATIIKLRLKSPDIKKTIFRKENAKEIFENKIFEVRQQLEDCHLNFIEYSGNPSKEELKKLEILYNNLFNDIQNDIEELTLFSKSYIKLVRKY